MLNLRLFTKSEGFSYFLILMKAKYEDPLLRTTFLILLKTRDANSIE